MTRTSRQPALHSISQAAIAPLFPPDQSCDIVIYTHVRVFNNTVIGTVNDISLYAFLNACKTYKFSTCGFSFHLVYMQNEQFENIKIRDHLNHSKLMNRVQNYGILNLYGWQEEVENYTINTVPSLLKTLRNLLGDDRERRKVFVGIGYYLYNTSKAWAKLEDIAEHVITPAVDVLVLMTTILTMPFQDQCITLPINAYKSLDPYTPTMACQMPQTDLNLEKVAVGVSTEDQRHRWGQFFLTSYDTTEYMTMKVTCFVT
ncbi:hypothetical protein HPB51_013171 [Rhipicephalus microplus]|uniref:Uncharacterized protein n=1 Tax=Rhipicephalus microplus TaxID=6941 RepID=A0A9J6E1F6_RHIMP|nr:hypothetical protein HPB51_013171 [Rhipicephalus microplus]